MATAGIVVGMVASVGLTRLMEGLLYGVGAGDVGTLAVGAFLLAIAAVIAALVPATRATRVDPVEVLRAE
jgi:ABC-type lipoprotein release transport system permease subunit